MERTVLKWLSGVIGLLVIVMLFFFSQSMPSQTSGRKSFEEWMTVSMPRPIKEMISGFSLADRNVTRHFMTTAATGKGMPGFNKTLSNKPNSTKGAVDKERAKAKAKAAAKAKNEKAWAEYRAREQAFRARIIAESEKYRKSLIEEANKQMQQDYEEYSEAFKKKQEKKTAGGNSKEETPKEEEMDPAAWKSLVLSQPNSENIQKMLKAFHEGKLDAQTYFEIVETLVRDNNEDRRKMGMWAMTSTFHAQAFTLASHLVVETTGETQTKLKDYMYGYNRSQTLSHLDQVLRGPDMVAAAAAADVITRAVEKLRAGQSPITTERRSNRAVAQGQVLTLESYQRFVPTLQWLSANQGNTLSQWAQNILSQLRTTTTPA